MSLERGRRTDRSTCAKVPENVDEFVSVRAPKRNMLQQGSTWLNTTCAKSKRWKLLNPGGLEKLAASVSGAGGLPKTPPLESVSYKQ